MTTPPASPTSPATRLPTGATPAGATASTPATSTHPAPSLLSPTPTNAPSAFRTTPVAAHVGVTPSVALTELAPAPSTGSAAAPPTDDHRALVRFLGELQSLFTVTPPDGSATDSLAWVRQLVVAAQDLRPASVLQVLASSPTPPPALLTDDADTWTVTPATAPQFLGEPLRVFQELSSRFGLRDLAERAVASSEALELTSRWVVALAQVAYDLCRAVEEAQARDDARVGRIVHARLEEVTRAMTVLTEQNQELVQRVQASERRASNETSRLTEAIRLRDIALACETSLNQRCQALEERIDGLERIQLRSLGFPEDVVGFLCQHLGNSVMCDRGALRFMLEACARDDRTVLAGLALSAMPLPGQIVPPLSSLRPYQTLIPASAISAALAAGTPTTSSSLATSTPAIVPATTDTIAVALAPPSVASASQPSATADPLPASSTTTSAIRVGAVPASPSSTSSAPAPSTPLEQLSAAASTMRPATAAELFGEGLSDFESTGDSPRDADGGSPAGGGDDDSDADDHPAGDAGADSHDDEPARPLDADEDSSNDDDDDDTGARDDDESMALAPAHRRPQVEAPVAKRHQTSPPVPTTPVARPAPPAPALLWPRPALPQAGITFLDIATPLRVGLTLDQRYAALRKDSSYAQTLPAAARTKLRTDTVTFPVSPTDLVFTGNERMGVSSTLPPRRRR